MIVAINDINWFYHWIMLVIIDQLILMNWKIFIENYYCHKLQKPNALIFGDFNLERFIFPTAPNFGVLKLCFFLIQCTGLKNFGIKVILIVNAFLVIFRI